MASILTLATSCRLNCKFPWTINDIDTLTVYKQHQEKLGKKKIVKAAASRDTLHIFPDSLTVGVNTETKPTVAKNWTICAGAFRKKENAIQLFQELAKKRDSYLLIRDSLYFVVVGYFNEKDLAKDFQAKNALPRTYIMKLKPSETLLKQLQ